MKKAKVFVLGALYPEKQNAVGHVCLMCVILLMLPLLAKPNKKVTVRVNKADVQEVFRQIKEQTGLNFVYDKEQMTAFLHDADDEGEQWMLF
ncbi:MAG: STN domain-containing protein [Butyricimonas faecalis]